MLMGIFAVLCIPLGLLLCPLLWVVPIVWILAKIWKKA